MSVRSRSNLSAQMCAPVAASINCPVMRTFPPPCAQTLKDVAHAEPASDLLDVDGLAFERKARITRDHKQPFESRERCSDFLNHPVGEVFLFRIAGHVLER
jgi:hypothetical protein